MNPTLKIGIETIIKSKRGFEFESLINQIYLIKYGSDGYSPTRERSDGGADGFIHVSNTIVASYGPDSYNKRDFEKKASEDFDTYLTNWCDDSPNWKLHYNGALAPDQIKFCITLQGKAKKAKKNCKKDKHRWC
ncbi:MAG: hypothetical protein WDO71_17795 [Bacteroidota bacterium]